MMYSDYNIKEALSSGHIVIDPISENQIQPASVDLRLGTHFQMPVRKDWANLSTKMEYKSINKSGFKLYPGKMVLATTMEKVSLPLDVAAMLEGRSSIGRLGLFIHNAGFIDPGWDGQITLELINMGPSPLFLESGRRICQILFYELKDPCTVGYSGKYQHQVGATGSKIYQDIEVVLKEKHQKFVRLADENVDEDELEDVSVGAGMTDDYCEELGED